MSVPFPCGFEQAALNHVRDGLHTTVQQRWEWLCEAMEVAVANARRRAERGEITLDSNSRVWWSPGMEIEWKRGRVVASQDLTC